MLLNNFSSKAQTQITADSTYDFPYYRNMFTPNGDGINDIFKPRLDSIDPVNFELWIFDRWGEIVFKTKDINKGWDGTTNHGKSSAKEDTYIWKIAFYDKPNGEKQNRVGHINLIR